MSLKSLESPTMKTICEDKSCPCKNMEKYQIENPDNFPDLNSLIAELGKAKDGLLKSIEELKK